MQGQLPKRELLRKYDLLQFSDVSQAVRLDIIKAVLLYSRLLFWGGGGLDGENPCN